MKKFLIIFLIVVLVAGIALLFVPFGGKSVIDRGNDWFFENVIVKYFPEWAEKITGESVDTREELDAPSLEQVGCLFTWSEVEDAVGYELLLGEYEIIRTTKTSAVWNGFEAGGAVRVRAIGNGTTHKPYSKESNVIELPSMIYTEANYKEYQLKQYEDIVIPATVEKVRITGDGVTTYSAIVIENRAFPLIIELDNVHAKYIGIQAETVNPDASLDQIVIVRTVGSSPSSFSGYQGEEGQRGADSGGIANAGGDGGTGGKGEDAARFNNVLFVGTQNITFTGGFGGRGGRGGDPGALQTKPGQGGNGGTGGTGLVVGKCYIAMTDATVECKPGPGGIGGASGTPGKIFGMQLDKERPGSNGPDGTDFIGEKIITQDAEFIEAATYSLSAPVPLFIGNMIYWQSCEGATEYIVRIGGEEFRTESTAIKWDSFEGGGKITVIAAADGEDGNVRSPYATVELPGLPDGTGQEIKYLGATVNDSDLIIPKYVTHCKIIMQQINYDELLSGLPEDATDEQIKQAFFERFKLHAIYIEERDTPLYLTFEGEIMCSYIGIQGKELTDSADSPLLIIDSQEGSTLSTVGLRYGRVLFTAGGNVQISASGDFFELIGNDFELRDLDCNEAYLFKNENGLFDIKNPDTAATDKFVVIRNDFDTVP